MLQELPSVINHIQYCHNYSRMRLTITILVLFVLFALPLSAQQFTQITDPSNPIVNETDPPPGAYSGCSWIDFDHDDDLDLFVNNDLLYRNEGGGNFIKITDSGLGTGQSNNGIGHGNSWADFDNDGDPDCFISGPVSFLYRNNNDGTFTQIKEGDIGDGLGSRGWASAWGDYNNDGFVDLMITHPSGFVPSGSATPNHLFLNNGDGRFMKIPEDSSDVTTGLATYTVGTWYDFDFDNDQDLFVASGPASGTTAPDFLYRNMLTETGTAVLQKITGGIIATDQNDGQVWNWIDYDNDGDLDGFLTNYQGTTNKLYRNDNGSYVKLTEQEVGSIVSDQAFSLANVWADFDNDGDLDVYITNDEATNAWYYVNNGDGTFTRNDTISVVNQSAVQVGATAGDYDRDGDQDLFVFGPGSGRALYRNESQNNGNHWININLVGTVSNPSAIGTRVRAKAVIASTSVWQIRNVTAQNSFNGHNSQNVHFGLYDATVIDSLEITWPSGDVEFMTAVKTDQFLSVTEDIPAGFLRANFTADSVEFINQDSATVNFSDLSLTDPNLTITSREWDFDDDGMIDANDPNPSWTYTEPGRYTVRLTVSNGVNTESRTRSDYIYSTDLVPIINVNTSTVNFGTIDVNIPRVDTTFYIHNNGGAMDSILVTLDPDNVTPESAVSVSPTEFELVSGDSQAVTFTVFPPQISPNGPFLTPKVLVDSRFGFGTRHFEKTYRFRIVGQVGIDQLQSGLPTKFALEQNYPNPFNPITEIRYSLPKSTHVTLKIYNTLAQKIKTLVDQTQAAGFKSIQWDATNYLGQSVSSGIYLYRIEAGDFVETRKMVLLQ